MNQFDITIESREPQGLGLIEHLVNGHIRLIAQAREQSLRDLAAPYLRAGYLPSELAAVERRSQWFDPPDYSFASVEILCKRSALRLWSRRALRRIREVLPWRG